MSDPGPSRTARMAAVARAMHLFHHGPRALLVDWLAWPLVGEAAEAIAAAGPSLLGNLQVPFTTWFAARSRITEDRLVASNAEQYVILGAGLDSFAWRQEGHARVFEVDRPSSQAWKTARVAALGLRVPEQLVWVPVDFERRRLAEALGRAGLDQTARVFVSWLGVIPYLTVDAIAATLRELPPCSLAVTYVPPEESWDASARSLGAAFQAQVRDLGEPWLSLLTRDQVASLLTDAGFSVVEDLGAADVEPSYGLPAVHHERLAIAQNDIV
jgi:methyltransferase (TIGR00027 family)